jgi:hypothetical protein
VKLHRFFETLECTNIYATADWRYNTMDDCTHTGCIGTEASTI